MNSSKENNEAVSNDNKTDNCVCARARTRTRLLTCPRAHIHVHISPLAFPYLQSEAQWHTMSSSLADVSTGSVCAARI